MTTLGEAIGWLVIFDRNAAKDWNEKIFWEIMDYEGKTIDVVGCLYWNKDKNDWNTDKKWNTDDMAVTD